MKNILIKHPESEIYEKQQVYKLFNMISSIETQQELIEEFKTSDYDYDELMNRLNTILNNEMLQMEEVIDIIENKRKLNTTYKLVWYVAGRVRETLANNISKELAYKIRNVKLRESNYKIGYLSVISC